MRILSNYDLTKLNTFGITAKAKFFVEIKQEADLKELFDTPQFKNNRKLFLGGGSNILFTKDFKGLVVLNKLKGIEVLEETSEHVVIRCMGGEIWHDLVIFTVERGLWGIENLSLIPGTVGAAPMQNIGAYGAELKDVLQNVEAYSLEDGAKRIFKTEECKLGYRDSIFKNELKDKYFITAITLKLSKIPKPNLSYKTLREYLEKPARTTDAVQSGGNKIEVRNSKDVSDAVSHIRKEKLPDSAVIPNAGSFFKNVFLEKKKMKELLEIYPRMPYFAEENGSKASVLKVPTAWFIEQAGPANGASWKGYRIGNVGVHDKQALVLVNYGGGEGREIEELAEKIIDSVYKKFGIRLIPEVNII